MDTRVNPAETKNRFSFWYFLFVTLLVLTFQYWQGRSTVETIPYSDFKNLLLAGKISNLTLRDTTITGSVDFQNTQEVISADTWKSISSHAKPTHDFITIRMDDPHLTEQLQAAKVRYSAVIDNHWIGTIISWVIPALVFVAIWSFAIRRMGGNSVGSLMNIGKNKAKVFVQQKIGVKFTDVEGIDEAKQELMEVVEFLRTPERFQRLGGHLPKGILIVGAPGTGKTLLAKAVAGEAQVPFLSISGSEFVEMFVGIGAARVRDLFDQALKLAPCIIFIDELDALGKARGIGGFSGNDEREQTLNQLLVEMDGFDTNQGVIIMAATNRPEILDSALLRPGRFDRHVSIDRPDLKGRAKILALHTKHLVVAPSVDLGVIAAKTAGYAGAELANIVNEAALKAARENKSAVDMDDFEVAIDRAVAGLEKRNRVMTTAEKETVAYHEAGHALIAEYSATADKVAKISIIPRGFGSLGFTQQLPTEDRYLLKRSELLDRLDVLLGGRGAEMLIFNEPSTGAQADLQRATDLVRSMVTQYGMSDILGPIALDKQKFGAIFSDYPTQSLGEYSEATARQIDKEVQHMMYLAENRVRTTLTNKKEKLKKLASLLLTQETVNREAFSSVFEDRDNAI